MNTMDIQLTYTTDGRQYHRAGNRKPILKVGGKGEEDCGSVYPPHAPFEHNGEIWLYYQYTNELHGNPPRDGGPVRLTERAQPQSVHARGMAWHCVVKMHSAAPALHMQVTRGLALAKIKRDRLVCIEPDDQVASRSGAEAVLTTVPLLVDPTALRINCDASMPGASVKVELCDPFDQPLPVRAQS